MYACNITERLYSANLEFLASAAHTIISQMWKGVYTLTLLLSPFRHITGSVQVSLK